MKICKQCKAVLTRRAQEQSGKFATREFCHSKCRNVWMEDHTPAPSEAEIKAMGVEIRANRKYGSPEDREPEPYTIPQCDSTISRVVKKPLSQAVCALAFILSGTMNAQDVKWEPTTPGPQLDSVVAISTDGNSVTGSGVIVAADGEAKDDGRMGYAMTANHVVDRDSGWFVKFRNGRIARHCVVVARDEPNDIALVRVWVPDSVSAVKVGDVKPGERVEFAGHGAKGNLLRHFRSHAANQSGPDRLFADTWLMPGDSGGPVFNDNREVVGVISGGWFWIERAERNVTWPARAAGVKPIRAMMERAK